MNKMAGGWGGDTSADALGRAGGATESSLLGRLATFWPPSQRTDCVISSNYEYCSLTRGQSGQHRVLYQQGHKKDGGSRSQTPLKD
jgi:hypothetical protein